MIIPQAERLQQVSEYYFSKKLQQIRDMRSQGKDVLNLGIGSPDLMPSEQTIQTLAHEATNPNAHGYQGYRGVPQLRQAIAKWYRETYNVSLNEATEILPLIGSKEGITHITFAYVNTGDEVLVPNPGYPAYSSVSNLAQANIRYYDLQESANWDVNIEALANSDLSKVKIMWINYPNMPTGSRGSDKMFEQLIALAHDHKFLIINDNPYSLVLNNKPKSIMSFDGAFEVALELNSLSKSHNMAGWRIGWVLGKQDYINTILKVKSNVDSGMFLPLQLAAAKALENSPQWHQERNAEYARRRQMVWRLFDMLNCEYDKEQVGMFVWAKTPDDITNVETFVEDILQQANVFITPGFIFGTNGKRYLRASLCNPTEIVQQAITRIYNCGVLQKYAM